MNKQKNPRMHLFGMTLSVSSTGYENMSFYVQSGGARPNLYGDVPWVVGFQKKCLPYLAPCSGPLEAIRKLVARFFG